jgi:hypothetical protein
MKTNCILIFLIFSNAALAQNVAIGIPSTNRAKFEVSGSVSKTIGIFGGENGISVMRNNPALGFNVYKDASTEISYGRYMGAGYAGTVQLDLSGNNGLDFYIHPSGNADASILSGTRILSLGNTYGNFILSSHSQSGYILDVGRGTAVNGTAMFQGSVYSSHINYAGQEDTYIRGGLSNSKVYLNDVVGGDVILGNGSSRIGVNYNNPVTTLEVRQVAGKGFKLTQGGFQWEWRVNTGSGGNYLMYYNGTLKCTFNSVTGAMSNPSDERIKTDIQSLPSVLENIKKLNPLSYEMKETNPGHVRSIGFKAQEVKKLFPQMVQATKDDSQYLSLHYEDFGVIGVKAVQEEQAIIDKLNLTALEIEKQIEALERKLKSKN